MCNCGKSSSVGRASNLTSCRATRKELYKIKRISLDRYKKTNSSTDLLIYNTISKDLSNIKYCPTEEILNSYKTEYGL